MSPLPTHRRAPAFPFRRSSGFLLFLAVAPFILSAEDRVLISSTSTDAPAAPPRLPPSVPRHSYSLLKEPIVFKPLRDWGTKIAVSTPTVNRDIHLCLQYDLSRGERVGCFAPLNTNLARCEHVRLVFQGNGPANTLEIQLTDVDGSTVSYSWPDATKSPQGTATEIPLEELTHLAGGDGFMDWTRVTTIQFNITKSNGGQGGRGQLTLKEIKFF